MRIKKITCLGIFAVGLFLTSSILTAKPRTPEMLSNTCAGCHGTNGASAAGPMPIIGGMSKRYLSQTLKDYKSGKRPSTIMGRIARGYSDLELEAIASFMASQPWVKAKVKTNGKMVKEGAKLHAKQCETCHENNGANTGELPKLSGQYPDYLFGQLRLFHEIGGSLPQPTQMRKRIQKLSAEELDALSHFYASQK
ncbi:MAG TPA: c-type cytochrome [Chromatiales bacterium]|nr:c-type cytochrome [Thiotrichales bacterium]HIP68018.1 c-type cytochrome [Chromatiales bacterium]